MIWIKNCLAKRRKRSDLPVRFKKIDGDTSEIIELKCSVPLSTELDASKISPKVEKEEILEMGKVSLINKSSLSINTMSAV